MEEFMKAALEEAKIGLQEGGIPSVPCSCGIIRSSGAGTIGAYRMTIRLPMRKSNASEMPAYGSYAKTILFTTLMPCYLCSGAIVQFGIERIVVGDSESFSGDPEFLKDHWVSIEEWDWSECRELMETFKKRIRICGTKISERHDAMTNQQLYIRKVLKLSLENVRNDIGGPFAALVVKDRFGHRECRQSCHIRNDPSSACRNHCDPGSM